MILQIPPGTVGGWPISPRLDSMLNIELKSILEFLVHFRWIPSSMVLKLVVNNHTQLYSGQGLWVKKRMKSTETFIPSTMTPNTVPLCNMDIAITPFFW